jgi:hypothetical protein
MKLAIRMNKPVMSVEISMKNRTIRWPVEINDLAERLAAERGLTQHPRRGVSELLEQLVREESGSPRLTLSDPSAGYKAQIRQSQKLGDEILKHPSNKNR